MILRIIIIVIKISDNKKSNIPLTEAIAKGFEEKAIIPSSEYKNNFSKDHFVLKPIHGKIPQEKNE
jgi:hypothetical protein